MLKQGRRGFFRSLFAGSAAAAAAVVAAKETPAAVAKVAPAQLVPPVLKRPADNLVIVSSVSTAAFSCGTVSFFVQRPYTGPYTGVR